MDAEVNKMIFRLLLGPVCLAVMILNLGRSRGPFVFGQVVITLSQLDQGWALARFAPT